MDCICNSVKLCYFKPLENTGSSTVLHLKMTLNLLLFMNFDSYKELNTIAAYLQNETLLFRDNKVAQVALHTGLPGIILTLTAIRRQFPELVDPVILRKYIDKVYTLLSESEAFYPSFSGGLAGYGFLLCQLAAEQHIDLADYKEVLEEIDEIIADHLNDNLKANHVDILHGAMGMALYFIEKGESEYAENVIDHLNKTAKREENRCYWSSFDHFKTKTYKIDFGLAHGNAGIQYFLAKCIRYNIQTDTCRKLLEESLNFYRYNSQDLGEIKSYYPTMLLEEHYLDGTAKPETSRVAWCYGDLGILYTHLLLADVLEDAALQVETITKLKQVAGRRLIAETMHHDAGLCHGTAGLALLFKNSYDRTGEIMFRETADYWLQKTYEYKTGADPEMGYCLYDGGKRKDTDSSLLEGLSGVAAAYLATLSPAGNPLIDKAVFLSL